jgi:hypothetical protein
MCTKAMVQDMYGSAEVMQLRDIDKPEIGDHDVLGHARAAGVNPADLAVMSGLRFIACPVYGLRKPATACVHVRSRIPLPDWNAHPSRLLRDLAQALSYARNRSSS